MEGKFFITLDNNNNAIDAINPKLVEESDVLYLTDRFIEKENRYVATHTSKKWRFKCWCSGKRPQTMWDNVDLVVISSDNEKTQIEQIIKLYDIVAFEPKIKKEVTNKELERTTFKDFLYEIIEDKVKKGEITLAELYLDVKEAEELLLSTMISFM